ncbi:uncharacterized protein FA14DRAFT_182255 [Meira miltonrushii]|uniref:CSC1/OSCA1-like 7TM region domain-containing protein n=1 Tax=Meira miltonrushii TaxID=1280837 RepID=A0A316VA20_9BASI|nr:uncharacterized protein FA14DRAFT_182255 [Meira miltonrushii]PWN32345.1 hypothetical protein FA14DRAFT_182255 [Meira miltonrushii]
MLGIAQASGERGERMVLFAYGGNVSSTDDERARLLDTSDQLPDPAAGNTAPKIKPRPTMHARYWNPFFRNLTPEPRDIVWSNVSVPSNERRVRQLLVSAFTIALFVFYTPPLTFLASLLSPNTIKKYLPGLYDLLRKNRRLEALLPVTFGRAFGQLTAKTPRQHAELNAPPQLYTGSVYPTALIVFTLGVLYSIVTPLIAVFAMIYFALAYLVHKYKLLFGFLRIIRIKRASMAFQLLLSTLPLPLIAFTFWFQHYLSRTFTELSKYVSLSSIADINKPSLQSGTGKTQATLALSAEIANAVANNGSTNDNSKKQQIDQQRNPIVALRAEALDGIDLKYRESPAAGYYYGILNTGRRRYGHPAVAGTLPDIWPPVCGDDDDEKDYNEQDQSVSQSDTAGLPADNSDRGSLTGVGSVLGRTRRQSRRKMSSPEAALLLN